MPKDAKLNFTLGEYTERLDKTRAAMSANPIGNRSAAIEVLGLTPGFRLLP